MKIQSQVLGELEIKAEDIITFPGGLPAFEKENQFVLIIMEPNSPFYFMQSTRSENLCFILANPFPFFPSYQFEIDEEERQRIKAKSAEELSIFTILTLPEDFKKATANLMAPVVINNQKKLGLQFIPKNTDYKTKHFIFPQQESGKVKPAAGEGL